MDFVPEVSVLEVEAVDVDQATLFMLPSSSGQACCSCSSGEITFSGACFSAKLSDRVGWAAGSSGRIGQLTC